MIGDLKRDGWTFRRLHETFGVPIGTLTDAVYGRTWRRCG